MDPIEQQPDYDIGDGYSTCVICDMTTPSSTVIYSEGLIECVCLDCQEKLKEGVVTL